MKGNEFANISSLFYVTYVVFELPWVIAVKRYGANWVLAIAIIGWSAITIATGFCHNYHQVIACRLLLGATEAGLVPALTFLISTIYPRRSQGKRVATLYGATAISGAFGGLIAYGIQRMGARQGLEAWRWLFIVEGAISLFLGIVAFLTLPKSASSAWFLSKEENALIEQRIKRDVAYTGEDEGFSWSYVVMALTDVVVWISALSIFCAGIPLFGFGIFLPTIIRGMGFESLQVNYLTIPVYVVACIFLGAVTWLSDRVGKRAIFAALVPVVVIIGYAIVIGTASVGGGFFAMFLCSGVYTYNTLVLAWVSNNIKPDYKRSAALPIVLSIANISGVAASQVYPNYTAPRLVPPSSSHEGSVLIYSALSWEMRSVCPWSSSLGSVWPLSTSFSGDATRSKPSRGLRVSRTTDKSGTSRSISNTYCKTPRRRQPVAVASSASKHSLYLPLETLLSCAHSILAGRGLVRP